MFIVVGERINSSRQAIREAVEQRDTAYIQDDVKNQVKAGADYIDVNAGAFADREMEVMEWLIETVQEAATVPLCLDSPDPEVLRKSLALVNEPPMINSITLEQNRFETILSFLQGTQCSVVALCMDDSGMPTSASQVIDCAGRLVEGLEKAGIKRERIYLDPLVQAVSTDINQGLKALEAVESIMRQYPGAHTNCGLSNVSFGLPERKIINRTFLGLMMGAGLDSAIIDPLDDKIMATVKITEMLLGKDEYCMDFIDAVRAGKIVS